MLNIDILLVLAIGLLQAGQAICGVYVNDKNRKKIVGVMALLGILTVVAGVCAAYRSGKVQAGLINGGDSYTVAKLSGINGDAAQLWFKQQGDYPLLTVNCSLIDVDKSNEWNIKHPPKRPGDKPPGERKYEIKPLPQFGWDSEGTLALSKSGRNNFHFECVAPNGFWMEGLNVRKINGKWLQAIWVSRRLPTPQGKGTAFTDKLAFEDADDGYPRKADGNPDGNY